MFNRIAIFLDLSPEKKELMQYIHKLTSITQKQVNGIIGVIEGTHYVAKMPKRRVNDADWGNGRYAITRKEEA